MFPHAIKRQRIAQQRKSYKGSICELRQVHSKLTEMANEPLDVDAADIRLGLRMAAKIVRDKALALVKRSKPRAPK